MWLGKRLLQRDLRVLLRILNPEGRLVDVSEAGDISAGNGLVLAMTAFYACSP